MDESAIHAIRDLAIEAAGKNRLDTDTPTIIIGGVVQSLEKFELLRSRFRGKFATTVLADYIQYVKEQGGGPSFIDHKAGAATTFFNLGTKEQPGHGDWVARLMLEPTAGYAAILKQNGQRVPQRALVEWVEDWSPSLSAISKTGEVTGIAPALAALRELKIQQKRETTHSDRDLGATRTALEDIEASSEAGIPSHIVFSVEPYAGFQARQFQMRVSIITGDHPAIVLRLVGQEAMQESIAQEFKDLLRAGIGDAASLTIGEFTP